MEGSVALTVIVSVSSILLFILCVVICVWYRKCWRNTNRVSNMSGVEEPTLSDDPTILHTRTKTLSLPSESLQASRLQLHPPSPSEVSETSSDDYNERMARQRQYNEYRTDKALKETYNGRFEERLKTVSIDYNNQQIQDIQIAVLELLARYADKINEHGKYKILRIEPCGSMVEKTAVWKTVFPLFGENRSCTEFDFLAVLERSSCLQIEKTSCQLCAKVTKSIINETHSSTSQCSPGITQTEPRVFNFMFEDELSSAIVSSCSCYCVYSFSSSGPGCLFKATSTQDKPGCEKCTVYTQTGTLQIDSSIKEHKNTLILMWTSDAMMLVAPDRHDITKTRQIKCLPILIDFLPAFEIFKPKINENELQHDCFIVPKHCVHYHLFGRPEYVGTWRISSCLAEIDHIVNTMSDKHRKCFKILKYSSQRTDDQRTILPGYHIKTAVLNHCLTCTESSEDCYTCVAAILEDLESAYSRDVLKSFSSKANLLQTHLVEEDLDCINTLNDIKNELLYNRKGQGLLRPSFGPILLQKI